MIKFLYRINAAFDRIREPNRFMIFMLMMVPGVIAGQVYGIPAIMFGGWIYLLLMLTVRAMYIHGAFNSGKPPKTVPLSKGDSKF